MVTLLHKQRMPKLGAHVLDMIRQNIMDTPSYVKAMFEMYGFTVVHEKAQFVVQHGGFKKLRAFIIAFMI